MIKERTKDMKTKVFSILADNTSGVLSRVSGLFNRRGFNIDSFTAGETEDPTISRMTVVAKGMTLAWIRSRSSSQSWRMSARSRS